MDRLISLLLSLFLLFGSTGAAPLRLDVSARMDAEKTHEALQGPFASTKDQLDGLRLLEKALSVLRIRFSASPQAFRADILAGEEEIVSAAVRKSESGYYLVSSLIPGMSVSISEEEAESILGRSPNAPAPVQTPAAESLLQDFLDIVQHDLFSGILERAGEPEEGDFSVCGNAFTARTRVDITREELALLALNAAKNAMETDSVRRLAEAAGKLAGTDLVSWLDDMILQIKNTAPEDRTPAEMYIYDNEDGEYCLWVDDALPGKPEADAVLGEIATAADLYELFGWDDPEGDQAKDSQTVILTLNPDEGETVQEEKLSFCFGSIDSAYRVFADHTGRFGEHEAFSCTYGQDGSLDASFDSGMYKFSFRIDASGSFDLSFSRQTGSQYALSQDESGAWTVQEREGVTLLLTAKGDRSIYGLNIRFSALDAGKEEFLCIDLLTDRDETPYAFDSAEALTDIPYALLTSPEGSASRFALTFNLPGSLNIAAERFAQHLPPETAAAVKAYFGSIVSQRIRPMLKEWRK